MLRFDVGIRRYTANAITHCLTQKLRFDIGIKRVTIHSHRRAGFPRPIVYTPALLLQALVPRCYGWHIPSFSTKTYKTLCVSAKGYGPLPFAGWGLVRGFASPRTHPTKGSSSSVGSWRWHKEKPWKQATAVTPISQFLTINSYRASRFSRFFLLWGKPEVRRLFLLRLRLAEACFGARRSRRRNKGRSPCITARVLFVFVRIGAGKNMNLRS